jgi:hypothetical protein
MAKVTEDLLPTKKVPVLQSFTPQVIEEVSKKTECFLCEEEKDPLVIKNGLPVCMDCIKEMEM